MLTVGDRLGPLSTEQKKRAAVKRTTLQKDERDKKKPQEITENDITRSENETTKNVATVRLPVPPRAEFTLTRGRAAGAHPRARERPSEPLPAHREPARLRAVRREPLLPFLPHPRRQVRARRRGRRAPHLCVAPLTIVRAGLLTFSAPFSYFVQSCRNSRQKRTMRRACASNRW